MNNNFNWNEAIDYVVETHKSIDKIGVTLRYRIAKDNKCISISYNYKTQYMTAENAKDYLNINFEIRD